jgi:hypothetical protein
MNMCEYLYSVPDRRPQPIHRPPTDLYDPDYEDEDEEWDPVTDLPVKSDGNIYILFKKG